MLLHLSGKGLQPRIATTGDFRSPDLLVGIRDGIGKQGSLVGLGALTNHLDELGVAEGLHLQLALAENLEGLVIRDRPLRQFHLLAQPVGNVELFDDRIEDLLALNHFKFGLKEHRVKTLKTGLEDLKILPLLFHAQNGGGLIDFGL